MASATENVSASSRPPDEGMADDEIIARVLAGAPRLYEILIRRYSRRIVHFILRMIGDADEAESLGQDVFVNVYENLPYYRMENNFQAFLFRIARNVTINWLKKQRRLVFFSRFLGHEESAPDFPDPTERVDPLEAERNEKLVQDALRSLPEDQRLGLILKVYLEFSYRQIADITGWSEPKIETLIFRAKKNMKKYLEMQETAAHPV